MHERNIVLLPSEVRHLHEHKRILIARPVTVVSPGQSRRVAVDGKIWKVESGLLWRYDAPSQKWVTRWPYGKQGDRLWVQETFCLESNFNVDSNERYPPPFKDGRPVKWYTEEGDFPEFWQQPHYRATDPTPELDVGTADPGVQWKPSSRMPRWASRFTLEIKNIQIFRLYLLVSQIPLIQWDAIITKRFRDEDDPWAWAIEAEEVPSDDD